MKRKIFKSSNTNGKRIHIAVGTTGCFCAINGAIVTSFYYDVYPERKLINKKAHALNDAKIQCFIELDKLNKEGVDAYIDTTIEKHL